jgi:hypothetical protein
MVMQFNVFNLDTVVMPLNFFNLDSYAVECLRHNHSTWMFMPFNVFGINV